VQQIKLTVNGAIYSLRLKLIEKMKKEISEELKHEISDDKMIDLINQIMGLDAGKRHFAFTGLGRVVIR
jgi:hypothetical protein